MKPITIRVLLAVYSLSGITAALMAKPMRAEPIAADGRDVAAHRGVQYLCARLTPSKAFIDSFGGPKYATTFSGLALLAIGSAGHEPGDRTCESFALRMGQDFLLQSDRQGGDGFFCRGSDWSTVHGHNITTAALGELLAQGRIWDQRGLALAGDSTRRSDSSTAVR